MTSSIVRTAWRSSSRWDLASVMTVETTSAGDGVRLLGASSESTANIRASGSVRRSRSGQEETAAQSTPLPQLCARRGNNRTPSPCGPAWAAAGHRSFYSGREGVSSVARECALGRRMNRVKYEIVAGDLLEQRADAIVNSWNRNVIPWWLLIPQGVSGAIKRRAGLEPFRELARHGPISSVGLSSRVPGDFPISGSSTLPGSTCFGGRRSSRSAPR